MSFSGSMLEKNGEINGVIASFITVSRYLSAEFSPVMPEYHVNLLCQWNHLFWTCWKPFWIPGFITVHIWQTYQMLPSEGLLGDLGLGPFDRHSSFIPAQHWESLYLGETLAVMISLISCPSALVQREEHTANRHLSITVYLPWSELWRVKHIPYFQSPQSLRIFVARAHFCQQNTSQWGN